MDESGVYSYTPSVGFPNQHGPDNQEIQQQQHPYPQNATKQCSVKGCADTLSSNDPNRMCGACRSRHRIYAITKRARRKLEKAAIASAVQQAAHNGKNVQGISLVEQAAQPITWITSGGQSDRDLHPSSSTPSLPLSTWNHAIDPRLFSGDVPSASAHHLSSPKPHQTSTSSELANALTPRLPSTPVLAAVLPNQTATDYNKHYRDHTATQQQGSQLQVQSQSHTSRPDDDDDDDDDDDKDEEQQVIASLQDQQMQESNNLSPTDQQTSFETAEFVQGKSSDDVDGSKRFCSVKGCKAIIPASYEYKMCPPCRTRYRTYGTTKRAKWKAERDAFDREMASLRIVEDENRKAKGLKSLADSPEELRAWELSIIDEQISLVSVDNNASLPGASSPVVESGLTQSLPPKAALASSPMVLSGVYPPSISSSSTVDSPHTISPPLRLNKNPLLAAAANTSLPARMCTVSHCHKILPGYYRYKRCEQHRLQNRHHSQLKRVREKEVKAVGPKEVVEIPVEMEAGGRAEKDKDRDNGMKQAKATLTTHTIGEGTSLPDIMTIGQLGDSESKKEKSHDQKRSKFSCSAGDCHNLLLPTVRWRSCESCRSIDRQRKNQIKFEQTVTTDKYYWSEKMNGIPQPASVSDNQHAPGGNGKAQESQQANHAANDHDAEGDIRMGENVDETEPKTVEDHQSPIAPMTAPLPPTPQVPTTTGGFSRFHVTIDPKNASSSTALEPTTSTAKLVTLDDPLAFRTYRPKTTPSAIGRILARNPGLSVDAFTEVLQAEGAITGVMTLPLQKETNGTSTTTKPIITPTIPTSAPFVYKAPEKKSVKGQGGTIGKGKRKAASSEKQSSPSTTPAPVSGVSSLVASAPPGPYGAYGYPQYPYPYPYYMPPPYGMPPYPYPPPPAPIPPDSKSKKSSISPATSSSPATRVSPSTAILGYSPYPYPYPPQPYGYLPPPGGYPYMPTRYIPGQHLFNGLPPPPPPGPLGSNPYPYPYYSPTPIQAPAPASASASFPKTATTVRGRQRTENTKFTYYHYGVGSSDTTPNDKGKRRKVDPDYHEKFKARTEVISMTLDVEPAGNDTLSSVPTPPPASVASDSPKVATPVISAQPEPAVDAGVISKPMTPTRPCANKPCHRSLPVDMTNTWCDKCRLRFKKCQVKARKRFNLEPRKFLHTASSKASSEKRRGLEEERMESGSVELD